jgi:hypothetical protein
MPKSLPLADGRQDGAVPPLSEESAAEIIADLNQPRRPSASAALCTVLDETGCRPGKPHWKTIRPRREAPDDYARVPLLRVGDAF